MKDFVIMTDSCCDMPKDYIAENNIPFVGLTCSFKGNEYTDDLGKSLNYKTFYDGMKNGIIPKTSQPNVDAFYKTFKSIADMNKDIIYICVSSGLSGTYNSANIAKNMIIDENTDIKIAIVDTLTASLGQGLLIMNAVELKKSGKSYDEVVKYLEDTKMYLNTYITVDDLIHLKRGGRISSAAALMGIVLHIKPILTLNDEGKVIPVIKVKGRKNALLKLVDLLIEKIENPENQMVTICHGDVEEEAEKLKEMILSRVHVRDVMINYIGPVIGTYGGPGALAVFFTGKHRQNHVLEV